MPLASQFPTAAQAAAPRHFMEPSAMALWTGVLLAVLLFATAGWRASDEYDGAIEREITRAELLANVLDEQAVRYFETAGVVMASLAELTGNSSQGQTPVTPELQNAMAQALVSLPSLRSMALVDGTGRVLASTWPVDVGERIDMALLNVPDAQRQGAISPWRAGRNLADMSSTRGSRAVPAGLGLVPYVYRMADATGGLMLVALFNPDALLGFEQLALEGEGRVALLTTYRGDVLAVARGGTPAAESYTPGSQVASHPVHATYLPRRSLGAFIGEGLGGDSVMAYHASRTQPLVVVVERPVQVLRAQWMRQIVPLGIMVTGGLLTIIAMTWATWRSLSAREQAQRDLKTQLDLTALVLEISPMPISMLDRNDRYLAVNKAWEGFMWRTREEVLGEQASRWMTPDEARSHAAHDAMLVAHGGKLRYEAVIPHADGSQRTLLINKVAVPGADGKTVSILCAFVDITEFREAELATREARDAAEANSRAKSEFIANISHELRTPLQAIIGFSEIGMTRAATPERATTMFTHINASGQRMLAMVNDLLDVSKIESAVGSFNLSPTDLRELVRSVGTELTPLLQRRGLSLDIRLPETPMTAQADSLRFQQVVRNVLANAIKFSPAGQAIELTGGSSTPGQWKIRVRDHGPGIPEGELEDIFDAFIQSSRTKDGAGGTGLGLAICRKIMDAHGGTIRASNADGGGACIELVLPVG